MPRRAPLPPSLGESFDVATARRAGLGRSRIDADDLQRPFHGVRRQAASDLTIPPTDDPFARWRHEQLERANDYATRMPPHQFFSHQTAAAIWGAAVPHTTAAEIHVSVAGQRPLPRGKGVRGHRMQPRTTVLRRHNGLPVASPASTWASLGTLPLFDLVALGDSLCRVQRQGVGRPEPTPPLATRDQLLWEISAGRRVGNPNLREAWALIREDAWSPRESLMRCILVSAGLPEPELNQDVFDERGRFLGCLDLLYRRQKVAVEYHGIHHHHTYARDVERAAALRAAGWNVIEVTAELIARPTELVRRVRAALRAA